MAADGNELTRKKRPRERWMRPASGETESEAGEEIRASKSQAEARQRKLLALHHLQTVWLQLRGEWSWLAVIPGEPELSTADFAHALSQVGSRLSAEPVGFIEATNVDLDSGSWLIDRLGTSVEGSGAWGPDPVFGAESQRRPGRPIVALENPIANPFALPVLLAADGVIVCVRRGRTPIASVRKTIEAVGVERVVCSVLVG